jgi:D-alanine-D-alanine ligase
MKPQKLRVILLFGGRTCEHDISLISAESVFRNLDRDKYHINCIYIDRKGRWSPVPSPDDPNKGEIKTCYDFLPWSGPGEKPVLEGDIYFPVLHGPFGEDGTIQGLFELAGVPYVGAGVLGSSMGMDKAAAKDVFKAHGIPQVEHLTVLENQWADDRNSVLDSVRETFLPPVFVKPANLGSSVGITKVDNFEDVPQAVETALAHDRKIIIEQGIDGQELECSVLGNDNPRASLPGEVIPARGFYDYQDKYIDGKTTFRIPAELPDELTERIRQLAVRAFLALDCAGMARVDFFLEKATGRLYINEINSIPGFTEISMYPKLWGVSGLPFSELLDSLIQLGLERHRKRTGKGE